MALLRRRVLSTKKFTYTTTRLRGRIKANWVGALVSKMKSAPIRGFRYPATLYYALSSESPRVLVLPMIWGAHRDGQRHRLECQLCHYLTNEQAMLGWMP